MTPGTSGLQGASGWHTVPAFVLVRVECWPQRKSIQRLAAQEEKHTDIMTWCMRKYGCKLIWKRKIIVICEYSLPSSLPQRYLKELHCCYGSTQILLTQRLTFQREWVQRGEQISDTEEIGKTPRILSIIQVTRHTLTHIWLSGALTSLKFCSVSLFQSVCHPESVFKYPPNSLSLCGNWIHHRPGQKRWSHRWLLTDLMMYFWFLLIGYWKCIPKDTNGSRTWGFAQVNQTIFEPCTSPWSDTEL